MSRNDLVMGSVRELGTVGLVAGLSGGYAAALVMAASNLSTMATGDGSQIGLMLAIVSSVFILIALYVSVVVMINCVDTVIAGRLRQVALLRLLGARAAYLRRSVTRTTALAGLLGSIAGAAVGTLAADLTRVVLVARGTIPGTQGDYAWAHPATLGAIAAVTLAAAVAGRVGSRQVLRASPAQAMSATAADTPEPRRVSILRMVLALGLVAIGSLLLAAAAVIAESGSAAGFFVAFFGASTSATGLLLGARFVIPSLVVVCSRVLGRRPAARVARRNAVKDPLRTTRATMGLVVGVALVTTFASGTQALRDSVAGWDLSAAERRTADQVLVTTTAVLIAIVVISSIIAAVGFVSTMSLTVIHRKREFGLLRSLGFTRGQVRSMITMESVALSATAVAFGVALGILYGSIGAQSLLGEITHGFVWGLPWPVLLGIALCGTVLVLVSSQIPARRAVAVAPVEALRAAG